MRSVYPRPPQWAAQATLPWVQAGAQPACQGSVAQSPPPPSFQSQVPGSTELASFSAPSRSSTRIHAPTPSPSARALTARAHHICTSAPRPSLGAVLGLPGAATGHTLLPGRSCQPVLLLLAGSVDPAPPGKGPSANSPPHHCGSSSSQQQPAAAPPRGCSDLSGNQARLSDAKTQAPPRSSGHYQKPSANSHRTRTRLPVPCCSSFPHPRLLLWASAAAGPPPLLRNCLLRPPSPPQPSQKQGKIQNPTKVPLHPARGPPRGSAALRLVSVPAPSSRTLEIATDATAPPRRPNRVGWVISKFAQGYTPQVGLQFHQNPRHPARGSQFRPWGQQSVV